MRPEIEEIDKMLNPMGNRTPLDVFVDFVLTTNLGTMLYAKFCPRNDVGEADSKKREVEYAQMVQSHAAQIMTAKENTVKAVATMLQGINDEARQQIMGMTLEQWFSLPQYAHLISEYIQDVLRQEVAKMQETSEDTKNNG